MADDRLRWAVAGGRDMEPIRDDLTLFKRGFLKTVTLPIAALIFVSLMIGTIGVWAAAREADRVAVERQVKTVQHLINAEIDAVPFEQQTAALWSMMSDEVRKPRPDFRFLDENVGSWMKRLFGHHGAIILDGADRPIYVSLNGRRVDSAEYARLSSDLKPLVDGVRGRDRHPPTVHDRREGGGTAPGSTVTTAPTAIHESNAIELLDRPAAASAMLIAGTDGRQTLPNPYLMISFRYFDNAFVREVAKRNLIDGLRFSIDPAPAPGEISFPFLSSHDGTIGYFFWRPLRPGDSMLEAIGPEIIGVTVAFIVALLVLARAVWRAGLDATRRLIQLRASEAQAQHLAFHDVLTGLPNRALFNDRLEQAIAAAKRGQIFGVLALDLDRFKRVNDTLGHQAGDSLIRELTDRFSGLLREGDTIARVGGDEFMILLPDVDRIALDSICNRILAAASAPFDLAGGRMYVGASIGIVLLPEAGPDRVEVLRKADVALYRAKGDGRNCYRYFSDSLDETVKFRSALEEELRNALTDGGQLRVVYQPEVCPRGNTVLGLEALIRWDHPTRGLICPEQFISIAEETGLIGALGEWVLNEAAGVARRFPDLFMAVNLSPKQIQVSGFVDRVTRLVRDAGCRPEQFEFEITESVLIEDAEFATSCLNALRAEGFRIALDDFGTGYSSLNRLKQFKVDKIKIDRSFTHSIGRTEDAAAIVTSVVTLGHAMGLKVTAEGVETADQRDFLYAAGCNELQGFLFSEAVGEDILGELIRKSPRMMSAA